MMLSCVKEIDLIISHKLDDTVFLLKNNHMLFLIQDRPHDANRQRLAFGYHFSPLFPLLIYRSIICRQAEGWIIVNNISRFIADISSYGGDRRVGSSIFSWWKGGWASNLGVVHSQVHPHFLEHFGHGMDKDNIKDYGNTSWFSPP